MELKPFVVISVIAIVLTFFVWNYQEMTKTQKTLEGTIDTQKAEIASLTADVLGSRNEIASAAEERKKEQCERLRLALALYEETKNKDSVVTCPSLAPFVTMQEFDVTIYGGMSTEQAVATGGYGWHDPRLDSVNFPKSLKAEDEKARIFIVNFGKTVTSEEVLYSFRKSGMRACRDYELLALGIVDKDCSAIALGSVWEDPYGHWFVPAIWNNPSGRGVGIDLYHTRWRSYCTFAAVKTDYKAEEETTGGENDH